VVKERGEVPVPGAEGQEDRRELHDDQERQEAGRKGCGVVDRDRYLI
jgi:hypothetical protein